MSPVRGPAPRWREDGIANRLDNCPLVANPDQADGDGVGDACNVDADGYEFGDDFDNCPDMTNAGQDDLDGNGVGDACNDFEDSDGDEISDGLDNCPDDFDPTQSDADGDGVEDVCDPFPAEPGNEKGQCLLDLNLCLAFPVYVDENQDGEADPTDACPATPVGEVVDQGGCSLTQFCASFSALTKSEKKACGQADWKNDEPVMWRGDRGCAIDRRGKGKEDDLCAPSP